MRLAEHRRIFFGARCGPKMTPSPAPHGHQEILRQEHARFFGQVVGARLFALPVLAGVFLFITFEDPANWRKAVLVSLVLAASTFFIVEAVRYRRHGLTGRAIPLNMGAAVIGPVLAAFASGGLASPIVYVIIPTGILVAVLVAPPLSRIFVGVQVAAVWLFAWMGATGAIADFNLAAFGGGARVGAPPAYLFWHAVAITVVLLMAGQIGRAVRCVFDSTIRRALAAQQESLDAHAERARELTALSGEIAHELKNPLASVKGLSGLLAAQITDPKTAERIGVLRHEVDRMQSILDEFLNFSRPLVPLAISDNDVGAICREVAALHEGMAEERGLCIELRVESAVTRCDSRKVKQILINLLQNALDASAAGEVVTIEAGPASRGGARIRLIDRGRGVEPTLGDAVFEPGVTSKSLGSGLGLTIARALARQHGGDVSLSARDGGGTVAEVVLPTEGTAT
jgi:two-component system, NtrC family, sensor histidine kinase HydH